MGSYFSFHETFVKQLTNGNLDGILRSFRPEFLERPGHFQLKGITFPCFCEVKDIRKFLIDHKCDIECELPAFEERRPIHVACASGHFDIVQFLVDLSCDVQCRTNTGWRPIHHACANGHFDIAKFLADLNCDVECKTQTGWRPIHMACHSGHVDIAKLLINRSCNVECETNMGCRPIHHASANGHYDIVKLLVDENCVIECDSSSGWTPIHYACASGHLDIVKYLVDHRCNVECDSFSSWRPIHVACATGHFDIVKFLIDCRCDVECKTDREWKPIHIACRYGHVDIAKYLIEHNCDVECDSLGGWRPVHHACFSGHVDIVKLLVENRCKLQCKTSAGFTPLDFAKLEKHQDCLDFFSESVKLAQFFECIRRNQYHILKGLNTGDILSKEEPGTGLSFLEVAVQSKATEVIKAFLNKRVDDKEIAPLKNYIETCSRPVAVELIRECLLNCSIRYSHVGGFQQSSISSILDRQGNIVSTLLLEIDAECITVQSATSAFTDEIFKKSSSNKEELARDKDLPISKDHIDTVDGIRTREKQQQQQPIPDPIIIKTSEDIIMISYSHSDEEIVKRIHNKLENRGFKLWIDFENMGNKVFHSMASAVQQCRVVIVCGSSSYEQSRNCEIELTFAIQRKKCIVPLLVENGYKPDGWLACSLSNLLRFNMVGKYDFDTSMSNLIRHLDNHIIIK